MEYNIIPVNRYSEDKSGATVSHGAGTTYFTSAGVRQAGDVIAIWNLDAVISTVQQVIASGEAMTVEIDNRPGKSSKPAPKRDANIANCTMYVQGQGCPLHGELCNPAS